MAALAFVACDESTTNVSESHYGSVSTLESGKNLYRQPCDGENSGAMLFVKDSGEVFFCNGEDWLSLKGADGEKGEKGEKGSKGSKGDDGAPGSSGAKGADGTPGSSGSRGADGAPGSSGAKGADGENCAIASEKNGVITLVCGEDTTIVYKALCGTKSYDPDSAACFENKLYSCDGKPFTPDVQYCSNGTVKDYGILVDERDLKSYKTITIGNGDSAQTWMAENLNYAGLKSSTTTYCYDDESVMCEKYGRMYSLAAALGKTEKECGFRTDCRLKFPVQGVCPEGWHVPDLNDWNKLMKNIGVTVYAVAGFYSYRGADTLLTDSAQWPLFKGVNVAGFSVLPSGWGSFDEDGGTFNGFGNSVVYWCSAMYPSYVKEELISDVPFEFGINGTNRNGAWAGENYGGKRSLNYVRCVQD